MLDCGQLLEHIEVVLVVTVILQVVDHLNRLLVRLLREIKRLPLATSASFSTNTLRHE